MGLISRDRRNAERARDQQGRPVGAAEQMLRKITNRRKRGG